ncbi:MAG: hypothetical protein ACI9S9_000853 [Planctomycetota bacterium]|jgi:hypothetical protein
MVGEQTGGITNAALVRALTLGVIAILVIGVPVGLLVFGADCELAASQPYFVTGLGAAIFAAIISVWLNGRITKKRTAAAGGDAALTARLEGLRLQGLMAAAFGAKLLVLTIGVFALRAFPLRPGEVATDVKFVDLTSFAVSFAGASLVMQLITATSISNSLRRRSSSSRAGPV